MVDNLTPQQRSLTMSRIRARDTTVELAVRRALHKRGHRYLVNVASLPGKPDVVFTKVRLAIFIDGDYWHGWRFEEWSHKLAPYWLEKIAGNQARDLRNVHTLKGEGWSVMRIWEHDVKKDLVLCVRRIEHRLARLRRIGDRRLQRHGRGAP